MHLDLDFHLYSSYPQYLKYPYPHPHHLDSVVQSRQSSPFVKKTNSSSPTSPICGTIDCPAASTHAPAHAPSVSCLSACRLGTRCP